MAFETIKSMVSPTALYERSRLAGHEFLLVTNNCWGYPIYQRLGRPYPTPFIGLYVEPEGYLHVLRGLPDILGRGLKFVRGKTGPGGSDHPQAELDGALIHFLHYRSEAEVVEKWGRRVARFQAGLEKGGVVRYRFCDREGATESQMQEFVRLTKGEGVAFCAAPGLGAGVLGLHEDDVEEVKGIRQAKPGPWLYERRYEYFDFAHWLVSGEIRDTWASRLLGGYTRCKHGWTRLRR
jgi:uncharacterized protein (DUF1919 family)